MENKQIDGRDLRDGGWFWTQQELLYVFTPLIGPEASWLYMVLCKMIPDKVNNPLIDLTIRSMQRSSGLSIGTVHRKLAVLIAIGMVEEIKGGNRKPSVFKLVNLKKLAALGTVELKRRLTVPVGNTGKPLSVSGGSPEATPDSAEHPIDEADSKTGGNPAGQSAPEAPAASGKTSVPPGNSAADSPDGGKNPAKMTLAEFQLFQKGGGTVPEKGGDCSSETAPLIKNLSILTTSPLPLSQAKGGSLDSLAASAEEKGKSKKLSHDGRGLDAPDALAVAEAVAKVKRECDLSNPRLAPVIELAMRLEASKTDETPDWNAIAERMARSYGEYLAQEHLMSYKPGARRFFHEFWTDQRKWPWDQKRLREIRRL